MRMKPSYRKHYFKLADERNCTKSLEAGEVFTSGSKKSNDIGSESCSVNVFEDGTILEDAHHGEIDVHGQAAGQSIHPSFSLDQQAMAGGMVEEEEDEHVEEGGKEENDDEEEEGETEHLKKKEKGDEEEDLTILAKEEIIKEEGEEVAERQDIDPLDMEVSDETEEDLFNEEQIMKSSNIVEAFAEERTLVDEKREETLLKERRVAETLVERRRDGETLVDEKLGRRDETLFEERRVAEMAEKLSVYKREVSADFSQSNTIDHQPINHKLPRESIFFNHQPPGI